MSEPSLDMTSLRRLVQIDKRRKEIDAEDKQLSAERTGLQEVLITQFEQCGLDKATVDGRTVYMRVQLWARAKEGMVEALCKILHQSESTAALVSETVNTGKLSAHFREHLQYMLLPIDSNTTWEEYEQLKKHPPTMTRSEALEAIKNEYQGTLELADQITLQSRGT